VDRNKKYPSTLETESLEALGKIFPAGFLFMNEYRGRRSVEGVLMSAAEGGNRRFKDFYKLARELRRYVNQAGHGFSYNESLNSIAIVMGYPSFRAAKRNSGRGIIPIHRLPEGLRHLKMPNLDELARKIQADQALELEERLKSGQVTPVTPFSSEIEQELIKKLAQKSKDNWFKRLWHRITTLSN
jgi:hypothetical protein